MAWTLSKKALSNALSEVAAGHVSDEPWDVGVAEDKLLGEPPNWDRYALWHLAYDPDADPETKAAYAYPYGDGKNVFRRAVAAIKARATQNGEDEIRAAADKIWDAIVAEEKHINTRLIKICSHKLAEAGGAPRRISVVAATEDRDRAGDIIRIEGIEVDGFLRNPVILAGHGSTADVPVIGKAVELKKEPGRLLCTVEFLPEGVSPLADRIFNIVKFVGAAAASVGLIVKEWKPLPDVGIEIVRSELLEISIVPVPANGNAVMAIKEAAQGDNQLTAALDLANELVQELAALVTALAEKLPKTEGEKEKPKGVTIKIRRA